METTVHAIDAIQKTSKILNFLTNEVENEGLCFILESCRRDLDLAALGLQSSIKGPEA